MNAFINDEAFYLVEHRRMSLVTITAVSAARRDDTNRRLFIYHGADLYRRGMGAKHFLLFAFRRGHEKRIMHVARGVTFGEVQRCEIMKVIFNVRPFGDRESHIGKDNSHFFHDLLHGVERASSRANR